MRLNPRNRPALLSSRSARAQRGVILIVALVVLVAMSLGGVAIMRSVDTATLIAGNMAFKNRTLMGADLGIETAVNWIAANQPSLAIDSFGAGGAGYYSSVSRTTRFAWENPNSWTNAKALNSGNPDTSGNVVSYVIHRLCDLPGVGPAATNQQCALDAGSGGTTYAAAGQGDSATAGVPFAQRSKMYLRITVRSVGPRNAVSYLQAMVLVGI